MLLGCIADDFTGSSDIANTLAKGGMAVCQYNGIPDNPAQRQVEAGVIALKSRTAPVTESVDQSIKAATWLIDQGCEQIFFKYCSTFDSTKEGNIGPVADALASMLEEDRVLFCPAFPATGRSIYQGNLFVDDMPLSESGMKQHPLTPMTDSDLRRWLQYQTEAQVRHIPHSIVRQGESAIRKHIRMAGSGYYIADAIVDEDLLELGKAAADRKFLTGGSGLAMGLPENFRRQKKITQSNNKWYGEKGLAVILSGSCSVATRRQVANFSYNHPALELTAEGILKNTHTIESVCDWIDKQTSTPLIFTSADPAIVRAAQEEFGRELVAEKIESFFGALAVEVLNRGVKKIICAGGETSGAIVKALGVKTMEIGPEIAPGVPALRDCDRDLVLALKSGNFGGREFFEEALRILDQ